MKRVIISLVILLSSIIICFCSYGYLSNELNAINFHLEECAEYLEYGYTAYAKESLNEAKNIWKNSQHTISLFITAQLCDDIEKEIESAEIIIEKNPEEALKHINLATEYISTIKENEKLSTKSVL